jgi:hypothetical protein
VAWAVTASLARLVADFRTAFPAKDRSSDGSIGDAAHQTETSGHNPDDTAGSRAEYSDADSKAEVRAVDVDSDLRDPRGVTMQQVIDRMLLTPADLRRLRYIIYNRRIWSRNTGWQPRAYTGSSPHTEHAHFSGDPDTDEDNAPWTSVLSFQEDEMTQAETNEILSRLRWLDARVRAITEASDTYTDPGGTVRPQLDTVARKRIEAKADATLRALGVAQADIDELQARPVVDVAALAAALAPLLAKRLDVELDAAAVLGVLESPEGQAALVQASTAGANAAEDS